MAGCQSRSESSGDRKPSHQNPPWRILQVHRTGINLYHKLVRLISDSVFSGCKRLASIGIHRSVTRIGNGAFHGCANLTTVSKGLIYPQCVFQAGVTISEYKTRLIHYQDFGGRKRSSILKAVTHSQSACFHSFSGEFAG